MDFIVYDNIFTYNKHNTYNGVPVTRLRIDSIDIPENHSFWFHTEMNHEENNINLNKRYVHIHPGIGTTNEMRFKSTPFHVSRTNIFYNPKEKRVEIGGGFMRKPVFAKKCVYYGAEQPKKKISIVGEWYFNFSTLSIIFIIDFNTPQMKFHWEDEDDAPTMAELENRAAELEIKVEMAQRQIQSQKSPLTTD